MICFIITLNDRFDLFLVALRATIAILVYANELPMRHTLTLTLAQDAPSGDGGDADPVATVTLDRTTRSSRVRA